MNKPSKPLMKYLLIGAGLVVLVLFLKPVLQGFSQTANTKAALSKAKNSTKKDYFNPAQGVKFKYPGNWNIAYQDETTPIKISIATKDKEAGIIFVSEDFSQETPSLETYTASTMEAIKNVPGYELLKEEDVEINNHPYHRVIYKNSYNDNHFITNQIWTVSNKRGYGFSYNSLEKEHTEYLPLAEEFFASIELF